MRRRILLAFEAAERERDPEKLRAWMTFVIVGGGPTGVELAGALGEIANDTLRHDFRDIDPSKARIILVEGADRVLPTYPPQLSAAAQKMLERLGVTVRTGRFRHGRSQGIPSRSGRATGARLIPRARFSGLPEFSRHRWAACSPRRAGATLDKAGRVIVEPDLTVPGHPEIFVIGDLANFSHQTGKPLPGVAQPAIQAGRYVAKAIERPAARRKDARRFTISTKAIWPRSAAAAAVADLNWLRLSGLPAWLIWIFIHLFYIIEFRNRLLVFVQWAWFYFTYDRSARLITGKNPLPLDL